MHDDSERLAGRLLIVDDDLEREFEDRMADSLSLAFRVAYGVLRQREDAEDVTQDAFANAYRHFHRLRDRNAFRAWLVRMTWRLALNRQRGDRRRATRERTVAVPDVEPARSTESLEQRERAEQLTRAIDALPAKLRIVTLLAGIEEHDIREVAALLRLPEGTVKSRLFLARQRLKELLQWTRTEPTSR